MDSFLHDLRYAFRVIWRSPGFTIIAVLALALGIGANTAIFSIVNAVVLKPLPYAKPEQLVQVWMRFTGIGIPKDQNWVSAPEFKDLEKNASLSQIAAIDQGSFNININAKPERVQSASVSASFFPMLGIPAQFGRVFLPEEDQPGHGGVVLLSDGLWRRRFGADRGIVGRNLTMNGQPYQIIGVLPRDFQYPRETEVWVPQVFSPRDLSPDSRGNHGLLVIGRIKDGLSLDQARADMQSVSNRIIEENKDYPYRRFNFSVVLVPLLEQQVGDIRLALWVMLGAVGLVLLIACANVANLLLVRSSAREREIAVRQALGVSRWRLVRQLLTESTLLGLVGGLAGLLLGYIALRVLVSLSATSYPRVAEAGIDLGVLGFTLLISIATGILFGLAPALHAFRGVTYNSLKEGGHGGTAGAGTQRLRSSLVVVEMAVSLMLLVGAGLLIRSFLRLQDVDSGFRADGVLTLRLALPEQKYAKVEQTRAFYRDLLERVQRLPGVDAAGATTGLPLSGIGWSGTVTIDTQAVPVQDTTPEVDQRPVTPGYFEAMGISLVRGRSFNQHDNETGQPVAIVDETLARTYWPNEEAIGKRLHVGGLQSPSPWMTIVGVVRHVRYRTLEAPSRTELYWPYVQTPFPLGSMSVAVHTSGDPRSLAPAVQREVLAIDPDQPVYRILTMNEIMSASMERRRLSMSLLAIFAGMALVLAAVGLYGVMSYSVAQRAHEMGIRMALGAQTGNLIRLVMGQGLLVAGIGVVAGLAGSALLAGLMSSLLFGTSSIDPLTFASVAAVLMLVALAACFVPAYRAARVDPVIVLRQE
ncbi:MAG TPA: ABC transporter permease [Candidatus Angelobacter sp.]|nr:ABC transporter permease [Candidatus Angelobacter sp.]